MNSIFVMSSRFERLMELTRSGRQPCSLLVSACDLFLRFHGILRICASVKAFDIAVTSRTFKG